MRSASTIAAGLALALVSRGAAGQALTTGEKEATLDAHNTVRCQVSPTAATMPPLEWDATLEATAQAWVNQCHDTQAPIGLLDHNPDPSAGHPWYVGENIYASGGTATGPVAVTAWASEKSSYDLATNTCSGVCGHYTQVVWASTRYVGCARWTCPLTYPSSIVCDYGPGGNTGGPPYQSGSAVTGACDLISHDGFEFQDLSRWSSAQTGAGGLTITAAAKLEGGYGLQAEVTDTTSLYVTDTTPTDENRYRVRFRFDPHTFDPGQAQSHFRTRIFIAFEESPTRRLAAIVLKRQGNAYSLMGRTRLDDNSQADTGFIAITNVPHVVEIDWKRSSAPGANDGAFQMWIDGTSVASLSGLDNSLSAVDFVRLGALSVKSGATGAMYWDAFESRRQTYIGP
jgi:uncharacterized protein YkwD